MRLAERELAGCFAIRKGELTVRLDPFYNHPSHLALLDALHNGPFEAVTIGDPSQRVSVEIIEGRITPAREAYSENESDPVFLRAQNVEEGLLRFDDAKHLTPEAFLEEPKAILEDGDLVLTIDGVLLGISAVHRPGDLPCCVSNHMVRIRHGGSILPDFLAAFLNCRWGQSQIGRGITGSAIPGLRSDAIRRILAPLPGLNQQSRLLNKLDSARNESRAKREEAATLLSTLGGFVTQVLGLPPVAPERRNVYAVRAIDIRTTKKLYPDYFHPERIQTIRALTTKYRGDRSAPLRSIGQFVRDQRGIDPEDKFLGLAGVASGTGELFDTSEKDGAGTCFEYAKHDILFARLRPYLNKVHRAESAGVCSTEFHVIRIHQDADNKPIMLPDYLAAVLRSPVVLYQTRHMMTGNTHPRLANDDVGALMIPIAPQEEQEKIVDELAARKRKARQLIADGETIWVEAKHEFEAALVSPAYLRASQ